MYFLSCSAIKCHKNRYISCTLCHQSVIKAVTETIEPKQTPLIEVKKQPLPMCWVKSNNQVIDPNIIVAYMGRTSVGHHLWFRMLPVCHLYAVKLSKTSIFVCMCVCSAWLLGWLSRQDIKAGWPSIGLVSPPLKIWGLGHLILIKKFISYSEDNWPCLCVC